MSLILTVALLHLLAVVSPGPDFILCARNSLTYSRRIGLWTAFGFSLGIALHMVYCIAGIAVVISQSILVFNILKWVGALYLIYIGVQSLRAEKMDLDVKAEKVHNTLTPIQAVKM